MLSENSVYELMTLLCKAVQKDLFDVDNQELRFDGNTTQLSTTPLTGVNLQKCRSIAYEIILKRFKGTASTDLEQEMEYQEFVLQMTSGRDYYSRKRVKDFQKCTEELRNSGWYQSEENSTNIVRFLLALQDSCSEQPYGRPRRINNLMVGYHFYQDPKEWNSFTSNLIDVERFQQADAILKLKQLSNNPFITLYFKNTMSKSPIRYEKPISSEIVPQIKTRLSVSSRNYGWEYLDHNSQKNVHKSFISDKESSLLHLLAVRANNTGLTFQPKIITYSQFSIDLRSLLIGIQSETFIFNESTDSFTVIDDLTIENLAPSAIQTIVNESLEIGTMYRRIRTIITRNDVTFRLQFDGFIYKTVCSNVERFLAYYRSFIASIDVPSAVRLFHISAGLRRQLIAIAGLLNVCDDRLFDGQREQLEGAEFLGTLYKKIMRETSPDLINLFLWILKDCCFVYFKRFHKWIYHGILEDPCKELFIDCILNYYRPDTKKFFDKAYFIQYQLVPEFLCGFEDLTLLCGKYTMLLKAFKPDHILFSMKAPPIDVCLSPEQLATKQKECLEYVQKARELCGPELTVSDVFKQKSESKMEFMRLVAEKFHQNMEKWKAEQEAKALEVRQEKERTLVLLQRQISESRERKLQERRQKLEEDREYLRLQQEEEDRLVAIEIAQRKKTIEYYRELGEMADAHKAEALERIKILKNLDSTDTSTPMLLETPVTPPVLLDPISDEEIFETPAGSPDNQENETVVESTSYQSVTKSNSDFFNSNEVVAVKESTTDFQRNKERMLSSTNIRFVGVADFGTVEHSKQIDSDNNPIATTENLFSDLQRNRKKVLTSEFGIEVVESKVDRPWQRCDSVEAMRNKHNSESHNQVRQQDSNEGPKSRFTLDLNSDLERNRKKMITSDYYLQLKDNLNLDSKRSPDVGDTPMSISEDLTPGDTQSVEEMESPVVHLKPTESQEDILNANILENSCLSGDLEKSINIPTKSYLDNFNIYQKSTEMLRNDFKTPCPFASYFLAPTESNDSATIVKYSSPPNVTQLGQLLQLSFVQPMQAHMSILGNEILKIFLQDFDILSQFKSLRNYYLMMDGEFASFICDGLISKLEEQKRPTELLNYTTLHRILENALGSSIIGSDKNSEHLSFIVDEIPEQFDLDSPNVFNLLKLSYEINWPLNLLLNPETMSHYAGIFQHLLKLRRMSWSLEKSYQLLKEITRETKQKILTSPEYRHVQQIRTKLLNFINALQNYVTANGLQASWKRFRYELETAKTIQDLYQKHVKYLKRVEYVCMLNRSNQSLLKKLEEIFVIVLQFYRSLQSNKWSISSDGATYTHPNFPILLSCETEFQHLIKSILRSGSKITRQSSRAEIEEFLDIININGYYD